MERSRGNLSVLTLGQQLSEYRISVKSAAGQSKGINHWWVDKGPQPQKRKMQQVTLSGAFPISQRKQPTHYMYPGKLLSCVWLLATPGTAAHQAPLSKEFSRQEHWSGLPFPPPGDLSDPGTEPVLLALAGGVVTVWATGKSVCICTYYEFS